MSGLIHDALVIMQLDAETGNCHESECGVRLLVELEQGPSCQRCARGEGCGAGLLSSTSQTVQLQVKDALGAKAGQRVRIEVPVDSNWLPVVAGAYGLPSLGLLMGAILPRLAGFEAEWIAFIAAATGLVSTIALWQRVIEPRLYTGLNMCRFDVNETAHTVSIEPPEVS